VWLPSPDKFYKRCREKNAFPAAGSFLPPQPTSLSRIVVAFRSVGARVAIATTTDPENVAVLLRQTFPGHGETVFDAIVTGDDVTAKKPDPEVFEAALLRLGLPAADCVAFEDSANGAASARGAGLQVVVTSSIYTGDDDFSGASSVISDLAEPGRPHRHSARWKWREGYVNFAALQDLKASRSM
jgi:beta-phosphoglucomutase-like phosphatase (HAD superfamily)